MSSKSTPIRGTRYKALARADGQETLDWDMLGAMIITKMLKQMRSVQEVDFRFGEATCRSKKTPTEWSYDYEKHDVVVFKRKNSVSSHLSFLGRGVVDRPMKEVAAFLRRVENNLSWDRFTIEAKHLLVLSETEHEASYIVYQRFEAKKCMINAMRDMLFFMKCAFQGGRYVQAIVSIEDPDYPSPVGVKRVEPRLGTGWVLENYGVDGSQTLITCSSNVDLKGLPPFITNLIAKRYPLCIRYVRVQLMVDGDKRRRVTSSSRSESDDEDILLDSSGLPDDFIPERSEDVTEGHYEQTVPIKHFIRDSH